VKTVGPIGEEIHKVQKEILKTEAKLKELRKKEEELERQANTSSELWEPQSWFAVLTTKTSKRCIVASVETYESDDPNDEGDEPGWLWGTGPGKEEDGGDGVFVYRCETGIETAKKAMEEAVDHARYLAAQNPELFELKPEIPKPPKHWGRL